MRLYWSKDVTMAMKSFEEHEGDDDGFEHPTRITVAGKYQVKMTDIGADMKNGQVSLRFRYVTTANKIYDLYIRLNKNNHWQIRAFTSSLKLTPEQKKELVYDDEILDKSYAQFLSFYKKYALRRCFVITLEERLYQGKVYLQLNHNKTEVYSGELDVYDSRFMSFDEL